MEERINLVAKSFDNTSLVFGGYRLESRAIAEQIAEIIEAVLEQVAQSEDLVEAGLIVDMQERKGLSVAPAECVFRLSFVDGEGPDKTTTDYSQWPTMRQAAASIDELLAWPESKYRKVASKEIPLDTLELISRSFAWRVEDLWVIQLSTTFGCVMISFHIKLENGDAKREQELSWAMMHAVSTILSSVMCDAKSTDGNMLLIGDSGGQLGFNARRIAKKEISEWLS